MKREFKKEIASLDNIFSFLGEALDGLPLSAEEAYAINLAVEEFFTNMVKYGTGSRNDVTISADCTGNQLTVCLIDRGVDRFDPTAPREADTSSPLKDRNIGGLGIHLVRHLLDDIRYSYADRASTITIIRKLER